MKFDDFFKLNNITLNITNYCNMGELQHSWCDYCFETSKNKEFMTKEIAEVILDKCYENYLKTKEENPLMVSFFGGEPFANWEVMEHCLKYSKEKNYNIEFGVTTNLMVLTDHMIDVIEEYELGLLISLDGIKEVHDRNRANSYDIVKKNLERLIERNLKYLIEVRMTVMPKDASKLFESIKSIFEMGIDNIAPVPVTDTKWLKKDLKNLEENLEKTWEWVLEKYNDSTNKRNISIKFIEDYFDKILVYPLEHQMQVCAAGNNTNCSIGVNGDILPCHQRHTIKKDYEKLVFGNILKDEIKPVSFNKGFYEGYYGCKDCLAKNICAGGCPSENLTENDKSYYMNQNQCDVVKTLVKVALKYQYEIMNSDNIRSHKINVLKTNLEVFDMVIKEVLSNINDVKILKLKIMEFYEKLLDCQDVLLPSFEESINNIMNHLKTILNEK